MPQEILGNTIPKSNDTRNKKSRKWCFTLNNFSEEEYNLLRHTLHLKKWKYILGKEVGSENETPHIQGFIEADNAIRFETLKKIMPRAHMEVCKGSTLSNYEYCSKDGIFDTNIEVPCKNIQDAAARIRKQFADKKKEIDIKLSQELGLTYEELVEINKRLTSL